MHPASRLVRSVVAVVAAALCASTLAACGRAAEQGEARRVGDAIEELPEVAGVFLLVRSLGEWGSTTIDAEVAVRPGTPRDRFAAVARQVVERVHAAEIEHFTGTVDLQFGDARPEAGGTPWKTFTIEFDSGTPAEAVAAEAALWFDLAAALPEVRSVVEPQLSGPGYARAVTVRVPRATMPAAMTQAYDAYAAAQRPTTAAGANFGVWVFEPDYPNNAVEYYSSELDLPPDPARTAMRGVADLRAADPLQPFLSKTEVGWRSGRCGSLLSVTVSISYQHLYGPHARTGDQLAEPYRQVLDATGLPYDLVLREGSDDKLHESARPC